MEPNDRIPLAEAAFCLKLTYHQVRALVLRGDLEGGQDELGHWFVTREGLQRLAATSGSARTDRPAARRASGGSRRGR
jgi:hypothetical protein